MTTSKPSLRAIQKAGAAVHTAEQHFRELVKLRSRELSSQLGAGGKVAAAEDIWDELKALEHVASELAAIETAMLRIYEVATGSDPQKRGQQPAARIIATAKGQKKRARGPRKGKHSNPERLLTHLRTALTTSDFAKISQSSTAREVGIPVGSITAALKRLLEEGKLLAGSEAGMFKLVA